MREKLKLTWMLALLSGEYQQGKEQLRRKEDDHGHAVDQFCCLGVLADVSQEGKWKEDGTYRPSQRTCSIGFLSKRSLELFGLTEGEQGTLAGMNDNGSTFETIAKWIDRHVEVTR